MKKKYQVESFYGAVLILSVDCDKLNKKTMLEHDKKSKERRSVRDEEKKKVAYYFTEEYTRVFWLHTAANEYFKLARALFKKYNNEELVVFFQNMYQNDEHTNKIGIRVEEIKWVDPPSDSIFNDIMDVVPLVFPLCSYSKRKKKLELNMN